MIWYAHSKICVFLSLKHILLSELLVAKVASLVVSP